MSGRFFHLHLIHPMHTRCLCFCPTNFLQFGDDSSLALVGNGLMAALRCWRRPRRRVELRHGRAVGRQAPRGLLIDVIPAVGYHTCLYLVLKGMIGVSYMLMLSMHRGLGITLELLAGTAQCAGNVNAD
ncbi:putative folate-biopterin transporter 2 [Panicum miliaceum]|uniref:Folate-biopterin transporter 2 n=1 Tax=Panicum miliaceum TaxID=4540 RepID=A0A3L6SFP6_PANMI|nr:putative folate-biopterin transporter 2 [Panicum miliaceum]